MALVYNPGFMSGALCDPLHFKRRVLTKTVRVLKLTAILLFAACIQVSAKGYGQSVTLSEKNASLEKIFREIRIQSGYTFVYRDEWLKQANKVDIDLHSASIDQALEACFKNQPLTYTLVQTTVVVRLKTTGEFQSPVLPPPVPPADIHGHVTDSIGMPLQGASVIVKGAKKGVQTDKNGDFVLKNVDPNATIIISFTGFESREFRLSDNPESKSVGLNIMLKHSNSSLDEVQIIAYGQTTQRLSTGDVTKVSSTDIEQQPVVNALAALEGRVPGMFITQGSGMPGSPYVVQIRGLNSLLNGNDPFYVIDGVPYSSELLQSTNPAAGINNGGYGSPLNFLNPTDIESISVLKDADATAIYGSRAANGAVLITTKKGKVGNVKLDINISRGGGKAPMKVNWLNTNQYLTMRQEAFANDSMQPNQSNAPDLLVWDTTRNTDWQKYFISGRATYNDVQGSISGGNTNTQYLFGGAYHHETTVFPGNWYDKKGSFHFNVTSSSNDGRFKAIVTGNYNLDFSNLSTTDPTANLNLPPDAPPIYNKDGTLNYAGYTLVYANNPVAFSLRQYLAHTNNLIADGVFSYTIIKNLDAKLNVGYTNLQMNETSTFPHCFTESRRITLRVRVFL